MQESLYKKTKMAIYVFSLYGEKEGPLKGWKKLLHRIARIYTDIDSMSWYYWLHVKAAVGIAIRWILGMERE
jgi:hypothetical protein